MNTATRISVIWILIFFLCGCGGGGGGKPDPEPPPVPVWEDTVGITQVVQGPGSATIYWGKAVSEYDVSYRVYGDTDEYPWDNHYSSYVDNNPVTISGLIVGQTYWFGVRAVHDRYKNPALKSMAASVIPFDVFKKKDQTDNRNKDMSGTLIAGGFSPGPEPIEEKNTKVLSVTPSEPGNFRVRTWGQNAQCRAVKVDNVGNVYAAGDFFNKADFNNGTSSPILVESNPLQDIFISKFNPLGQLEWVRAIGSQYGDFAFDIVVDSSGGVYVTGIYSGSVDFDPMEGIDTRTAVGWYDSFLLKLNSDGTKAWVITWGGVGQDTALRVSFDPLSNSLIVSGGFSEMVDFDPGSGENLIVPVGDMDAYCSRIDINGNLLKTVSWSANFEFDPEIPYYTEFHTLDPDEILTAIGCNMSSNIYLAGKYRAVSDLNPGNEVNEHISNGLSDAYILKLDQNGNYMWSKSFGGPLDDSIIDLALDSSGNVYATGNYIGPVDFTGVPGGGPEYASSGEADVFLTSFDPDGNFRWVCTWGGTDIDKVSRIKLDASDNIFALGGTMKTVYFNPPQGQDIIPPLDGCSCVNVFRFNPQGNLTRIFSWCRYPFSSSSSIILGQGLDVDSMSNISISGYFNNSYLDFDKSDGVCALFSSSTGDSLTSATAFVLTINPDY